MSCNNRVTENDTFSGISSYHTCPHKYRLAVVHLEEALSGQRRAEDQVVEQGSELAHFSLVLATKQHVGRNVTLSC